MDNSIFNFQKPKRFNFLMVFADIKLNFFERIFCTKKDKILIK